MNLFDRIKYYKIYKEIINKHKETLLKTYNVRVDDIYRLYTVYNISLGEYKAYGGDKKIEYETNDIEHFLNGKSKSGAMINGEEFFERKVKAELNALDTFLINIGLSELYGMTEKSRLDRLNMKVVIEYKYLRMKTIANLGLFFGACTIIGLIIILFLMVWF